MGKLESLIKKVNKLINTKIENESMNEDDFIEALGLDPKNYEKLVAGNVVGYDSMKALFDSVEIAWNEDNSEV